MPHPDNYVLFSITPQAFPAVTVSPGLSAIAAALVVREPLSVPPPHAGHRARGAWFPVAFSLLPSAEGGWGCFDRLRQGTLGFCMGMSPRSVQHPCRLQHADVFAGPSPAS